MPKILAFIYPDGNRKMRENIALLLYTRCIKVTDDMKHATIVIMPGDEPKSEDSLHKEIEQMESIYKRLKHTADKLPDIVIQTHKHKKKQSKLFAYSTTFKKYRCAKTVYSQNFFNRTTCK